jgi:signal transduction histidine kinase
MLADAFSEFIASSSRLESSYHQLQQEVCELSLELSRRNAALEKSQAENERMRLALQQIVDFMPCGVLVLGREGEILVLNPEAQRLLGADKDLSARDKAKPRWINGRSGLEDLKAFANQEESGEAVREFHILDGGPARWIEARKRHLVQAAQTPASERTILVLRDVTAQKRAEQDRESGRKAMALAEVGAVLAHEIRNPLASLELFARLIEIDEDERDQWISHLRAGIRSLSGTVNNVLSFHSGALVLAPIHLYSVIVNALRFVKPLAAQTGVSLDWPSSGQWGWILGNEEALQQVVLNLVSNAVRHTPPSGRIAISFRSEPASVDTPEQVLVEFADTGCGIASSQIGRIFEQGFSGGGNSAGLGLAVCERIMKEHGGGISAANGIHGGARFTLRLPLLKPEVVEA